MVKGIFTEKFQLKTRLLLIVLMMLLLMALLSFFTFRWIFQGEIHRQISSPKGEFIATIVKQRILEDVHPVTVILQISSQKGRLVEEKIDYLDMWIDCDEKSYPFQWESDTTLLVGSRRGDFNNGWKVNVRWPQIEVLKSNSQ